MKNEGLIKINFIYNNKKTPIECKKKGEIIQIIKTFCNKYNLEISDYNFFNKDNPIDLNEQIKEMDIIVLKKDEIKYEKMNNKYEYDKVLIRYKLNKDDEENKYIKIFGTSFVINNKNKCKIKYKGIEYELQENFDINNINEEILEIELIITDNIYDISGMFNNCSIIYLSEFNANNIINMSYMFKDCSELKNL